LIARTRYTIRVRKKRAGEVVKIDERNRTIDLKRGVDSQVPHPEALIPSNLVDSTAMIDSLLRLMPTLCVERPQATIKPRC
jgi:hypothetical protein